MGFLLDSLFGVDMDFDGKTDAFDDFLFIEMMEEKEKEDEDNGDTISIYLLEV